MADITVDQIHELRDFFVQDLYSAVRDNQTEDLTYYNDTFDVSEIKPPHRPLRSGLARRIIDSPAEQMVTRNPQAFIDCTNDEVTKRLSELTNYWISILRRQNPNPFKESVKNPHLLGETFVYIAHDEKAFEDNTSVKFPIKFIVPDPTTVYASIEEDENGIPNQVIIISERGLSDVRFRYPNWTNPQNNGDNTGKRKVKWMAYFDKNVRYFEADDEAVLDGKIQENIYGFTQFIRRYSGFGRRDAKDNLANLIVGELRGSRGLLQEECLVRSDIASSLHLYAHPRQTLIIPQSAALDATKLREAYSFEPGTLTVLPLPPGSEFDKNNQLTPVPEVFTHLQKIQADIVGRHPLVMAGSAVTNSGRQDDLMGKTIMHRYETIIENVETMFATAIEKGLEICKKLKYTPEGLKSDDLDHDFTVKVLLRAEDSLEAERKATLGGRMYAAGQIDLQTLHTEYLGYTQAQSDEIQANMIVDKLTFENPDVMMVLGMKFAEEAGLAKYIEQAQQAKAQEAQQAKALSKATPPSGQQRMQGETMTESGFNMIDQSLQNRGARQPPTPYTRGQ